MISTKQHVYQHRKAERKDLSLVKLTLAHDLLSRAHEIRTRVHDLLSRANEFVSRAHDIKYFTYMSLSLGGPYEPASSLSSHSKV